MADDLIKKLRGYAQGCECFACDMHIKAADALARKDAEIVALQKECAELRDLLEELDANRSALKWVDVELAALRERIEKAPVVQVEPAYTASMHGMGGIHCATINVIGEDAIAIGGKRVALVALEE